MQIKNSLASPVNPKTNTITKKLQQQLETTISRNDNPKITVSAGVGGSSGGGTISSGSVVGTPGLKKNQSAVKKNKK